MNYKVVLRKENTVKEITATVSASTEAQAIAEAKQSFQWQYGFMPNQLVSVSVEKATPTDTLIRVVPVSKRGKQLVKEHGDLWQHRFGPRPMQCFDNELGIQIETIDGCQYRRNIRVRGDNTFFWIYETGEDSSE